ncbi:hypothetical protein [Planobispora longispora]|uniref:Uncharacterized protein n=1 Tax=Planobispora longispora TaxID=28887 RepID=A0A8J3RMC4_9ACTN|nr:hypothetical protein [Planobispora longispora]GIH79241.1 hypothetical protein Plo01_56700 [Planobispora longispora]
MTDPHTGPDAGSDARAGSGRGSTPRWVKVSGIIAVLLLLLALTVMLASGGDHGPGRHLPGGGADPRTHLPHATDHGAHRP